MPERSAKLWGSTLKGLAMAISPGMRKWLANRLRQVAEEEEKAGAKSVAAGFRRHPQELLVQHPKPEKETTR